MIVSCKLTHKADLLFWLSRFVPATPITIGLWIPAVSYEMVLTDREKRYLGHQVRPPACILHNYWNSSLVWCNLLRLRKGAVEKAAVDLKRSAKACQLPKYQMTRSAPESGCHQSTSQIPVGRWDERLCGDALSLCTDQAASTAEPFQWHEWLL